MNKHGQLLSNQKSTTMKWRNETGVQVTTTKKIKIKGTGQVNDT